MKCFYHPEKDAVGVCRNCLRGLCPDCASDVGDGIACKGRCENKAKEYLLYLQASLATYKAQYALAANSARSRAKFTLMVALLFFAMGIPTGTKTQWNSTSIIMLLAGVFLVFFSITKFRETRQWKPIVDLVNEKSPQEKS